MTATANDLTSTEPATALVAGFNHVAVLARDLDRWVEVCTEAYSDLRAGVERPPLQPYGATNPAEFFAVATEAFFDVPVALEHNEPSLYEVMRDFYKQDPATRLRG